MASSALQPLQPQQPNLSQRFPILTLADTFQSPFSAVDLTCLPLALLPSYDILSDSGFSSNESAITSMPFYGISPSSASQDPMMCNELTLEAVLRDLMSQSILDTTDVKATTQQSSFPPRAQSQGLNGLELGLGGDKKCLPFNISDSVKRRVDVESFSHPLQPTLKRQKSMPTSPTTSATCCQAREITFSQDLDNDQPSPHKRKLARTKVTDSAHYRPRNAFFMFRGFVSRIQSTIRPKPAAATTRTAMTGTVASVITSPSMSPASSLYLPPTKLSLFSASDSTGRSTLTSAKGQGVAQTKVSVSCGKIWSSECFECCGTGGCANCRMRSLFGQASDFLKLRQTELERQIEFSEIDDRHNKLDREANTMPGVDDKGSNELSANSGGRGGLARLALEDSFNWKEFQQLYYDSDLFQWHRDKYLQSDGNLNLEEMKRVWMENERCYEKVFLEGARRRILQNGSRNVKKAGQRPRKVYPTS
ncbi:hypothetical protein BGZ58_005665 [Dissophora ornata]|nr:hypothetical protein BGZ58_005665 [Dissophora ornata]